MQSIQPQHLRSHQSSSNDNLANESAIRQFTDWQKSKNAFYDINNHSIKWNFNDPNLKIITYTNPAGLEYKLEIRSGQDPIRISTFIEALDQDLHITGDHRQEVLFNIAQIITDLNISKANSSSLKENIELFDALSLNLQSEPMTQVASSEARGPSFGMSEELTDAHRIRIARLNSQNQYLSNKLKDIIINASKAVINAENKKFEYINNENFKINIGETSQGIKSIVYIDKKLKKTYVGEVHDDKLTFHELRLSEKPSLDNKIGDPTKIGEILTLISSAINLTSTQSYKESGGRQPQPYLTSSSASRAGVVEDVGPKR